MISVESVYTIFFPTVIHNKTIIITGFKDIDKLQN